MKTLSCREAGFDCDYVVKGETEGDIQKWSTTCYERSWNERGRHNSRIQGKT